MYSYSQLNYSFIYGYLIISSTFYSSDEYHKTQGKRNTQVQMNEEMVFIILHSNTVQYSYLSNKNFP